MRRFTPIAVLAVLLGASACQVRATPQGVHETKSFPARPDKLVRLDLTSLDVQVKVAEADSISVTVDLQVQSSSRGASRRWVERHTPVFEDSDSVLEVRMPEGEHRGIFIIGFMHTRGRVELSVPPSCRLEVRTSSGDVRFVGGATLAGPVRVHTTSGDVTVTGGVGDLIAETSSGDVHVSGPPLGSMEADTSSGEVTLLGGAGKAVVDTSSGEVRLNGLTGSLSADTSSGDVRADWERLPAGSSVRIRTASGDVRLRVPPGTPLKGRLDTVSGRLHSEIASAREERGRELTFEASGEGVQVGVRTTSGDVTIRTGS